MLALMPIKPLILASPLCGQKHRKEAETQTHTATHTHTHWHMDGKMDGQTVGQMARQTDTKSSCVWTGQQPHQRPTMQPRCSGTW